MLTLPDKRITAERLVTEFAVVGLPRLQGVSHSNREIDGNGRAIIDEDGKPKKVASYTLIKCDLTARQEELAKATVAAHVADPELTEADLEDQRKDSQLDQPVIKAIISTFSSLTNSDEATVREAIKAQL